VEREGAEPSLHQRLMHAVLRGAQAQEDSRLILAQHADVDKDVFATLRATDRARARRARDRDVRIRTGR
jgi:hypothetical protein